MNHTSDTIDYVLNGLKFLSIMVGSVSGIIGLMVDFRNKRTHKITKNGYLILWSIFVTFVISAAIQSFEIVKEKAKNKQQQAAAIKQQQKTDSILNGLNRTLNPLANISVNLDISHPFEKELAPYFNRIDKGAEDEMAHMEPAVIKKNDPNNYSPIIPVLPNPKKERLAFELLCRVHVEVKIYKKFDFKSSVKAWNEGGYMVPEISLDGNINGDKLTDNVLRVDFPDQQGKHRRFEYEFQYDVDDKKVMRTHEFNSTADLANCTVVVTIQPELLGLTVEQAKTLNQSFAAYDINLFSIEIDHKAYGFSQRDAKSYTDSQGTRHLIFTFENDPEGNRFM